MRASRGRWLIAVGLLVVGVARGQQPLTSDVKMRALEERVKSLEDQVASAFNWTAEIEGRWHNIVIFDPTSPGGFQRLDTDTGPFFIKIGTVEPYLDGYKVYISAGNPSASSFSGFKLSVKWGRRRKPSEPFLPWANTLKEKVFDKTEVLLPGKWNAVVFNLPGTSAADFGYLQIGIDVETVMLEVK